MKNTRNARKTLYYIVAAIGILCMGIRSQPILGAQGESIVTGRENPFAKIDKPKVLQTPASTLASSEFTGEGPELLVAIVTPRSLNAQTLASAIEG